MSEVGTKFKEAAKELDQEVELLCETMKKFQATQEERDRLLKVLLKAPLFFPVPVHNQRKAQKLKKRMKSKKKRKLWYRENF